MKLHLIVLFLVVLKLNEAKLSTSKTSKSKLPKNAIIAIQIIDPNENSTSAKNSKRTIESSLGYGYQGNFVGNQGPPKYEIYKYSQHDIPAYSPNQYTASAASYHSPSVAPKPVQNTGISNFYQPGTILFSTINQQGQLGELSSQFPGSLEDQQYPIPVIILRVHPDQLANPLYPKLPQNHLHASAINSIDINSLLSNYIGNSIKQQSVVQHQPVIQHQPVVQQQSVVQHQPVVQQQSSIYQQQQPQHHQQQEEYDSSQAYVQPQAEAVQYQSNDYQVNDYQSSGYQSQQYYPQYQYEESQEPQNQNYQTQQHVQALPEPRVPDANYQYSNYQVVDSAYQQPSAPVENHKTELLTDENYPSDKHTQVIFKRSKGKSSSPRNRHSHRSVPKVQARKSHQTQPQSDDDEGSQSSPKYYQQNGNYYTIQYSDEQDYTNQKAPSYGVKEQDDQPEQGKNYVYASSDSRYNPHV